QKEHTHQFSEERYKLQYDAIQPIPYIKDRLYCVDKVFVEGGTEIYIVKGATKEIEGPWVRVDSYKDIFTDPRMISQTAHHRSRSRVWYSWDGYDEFPDRDGATGSDVGRIITSNLLGNIDVTLTTRYLPKDYDKANTKRVRLVGFDAKARDQYIRKAVTGEDDESVAKIKRALQANPILDDLCQVPLIFVMFSHMPTKRHFSEIQTGRSCSCYKSASELKNVLDKVDPLIFSTSIDSPVGLAQQLGRE
ncbi:hypothetical protein BSL78_26449, partial [Apostichopus japonicus]